MHSNKICRPHRRSLTVLIVTYRISIWGPLVILHTPKQPISLRTTVSTNLTPLDLLIWGMGRSGNYLQPPPPPPHTHTHTHTPRKSQSRHLWISCQANVCRITNGTQSKIHHVSQNFETSLRCTILFRTQLSLFRIYFWKCRDDL
jgi:hypothetical protein